MNLDLLLEPISPEAPSGGKDLSENDPAFFELESMVNDRVKTDRGERDPGLKAAVPSWNDIKQTAYDLCTRAHDLRVAMILLRALVHTQGLPGLREGFNFFQGLIERYWDTVYPQLDSEDPDPAGIRIGVLEDLDSREALVGPLTEVTLCASREVGKFSLRDYYLATGQIALTEEQRKKQEKDGKYLPRLQQIEAAFEKCGIEDLQANQAATASSLESLHQIELILKEKAGPEATPTFGELSKVLKEMDVLLTNQLKRRGAVIISTPESRIEGEGPGPESENQPGQTSSHTIKSMDTIRSRQDVSRLLQQICQYYEQNEPASPVPLLLKRAMRLVEKSFIEILEDLAPESLPKIQLLSGSETDQH